MKQRIYNIIMFFICTALMVSLSGCGNNEEQIANLTDRLNNTYWKWVDTSPSAENCEVHEYVHIRDDGTVDCEGYTHLNSKVTYKDSVDYTYGCDYSYTWEVLMHRGKPYVRKHTMIDGEVTDSYTYFLADINKEGKIENMSFSMYLPGTEYYSKDKLYTMEELSQEEYLKALKEEEANYIGYSKGSSNKNGSSSFTNKYGTKTTKCAHAGCNNFIASNGDTNCCTVHSNRCLNCNKYIDEDAMYCMSCIKSALGN